MQRTGVFYDFEAKYPTADVHELEGNGRVCEIRIGMLYDIVEEVFVGMYLEDGSCRFEERIQEPALRAAAGSIRVFPETALAIAKERVGGWLDK
ncbi:hypothetical protein IB274_02595 [Pseudomonas sp. PDM18]|uniref:hypothetical protein n=1 Tax=Pseudomonas sp. PDM18 TaxID=2769253 RepID=UPI00178135FD|nr:hypothetical protein [Pseudomonas sp. PDM18]MBD9675568.1 hypothetical protein [Pseudomonas sp. PDM18]